MTASKLQKVYVMKKLYILSILFTNMLSATTSLEDAVMAEQFFGVKRQVRNLLRSRDSVDDKQRILRRAYGTALDIIQEKQETLSFWNSWRDIIKVYIGGASLPLLVKSTYAGNAINGMVALVGCYIGIRGLQCKAQIGQLEEAIRIKNFLENAVSQLNEEHS